MLIQDNFITVGEAAKWLKISPQTLRNKLSKGDLPFTKFGGRTLLRVSDLETALLHFTPKAYRTPGDKNDFSDT